MKQLGEHYKAHYGQLPKCPKCGHDAVRASVCSNCGKVFPQARDRGVSVLREASGPAAGLILQRPPRYAELAQHLELPPGGAAVLRRRTGRGRSDSRSGRTRRGFRGAVRRGNAGCPPAFIRGTYSAADWATAL